MIKKLIACNLCGSPGFRRLTSCNIEKRDANLPVGRMDIVKCSDCGLVYANPRPEYSKGEFDRLYSEEYFNAPYMRFYIGKEGRQTNEPFKMRLEWIERFRKGGKILDIGCASGGFLKAAKDRGWEACGLEISRVASDEARRQGLNVVTGGLDDTAFGRDYFDVVTASDVLEHTGDPRAFLVKAKAMMKKGGLLYIAVPDFDGLYYKVAVFISGLNHKNYFVLPHHIYFFNRATLTRYLAKAGFKIVDIKKSEANISTGGIKGKIMLGLFLAARLVGMQDRILFLAEKEG